MNAALYYPYSRCLNETALKRAVLLFDELLFVDPVDPAARSALYLREGAAAGGSPALREQWGTAQANYDLLERHGIVRTVDSTVLRAARGADALAAGGLALDIDMNDSPGVLFAGQRRWQMLEARVPPSALDGRFRPRPGPSAWTGEPVVEVPYAVGASVALTYALAISHELGVTPFTDNRAHDALLRQRLNSASMMRSDLPGVYASVQRPYLRRQVELQVASTLASAAQLRKVSLQNIIDYRNSNEPARQELAALIGQLTQEAQQCAWDGALDDDLNRIAQKAIQIADGLPGPRSAWHVAKASAGKPSLKLKLGSRVALTALVAPHLPLVAGLGAGALALSGIAKDSALDAYDELRRARTPEENAIAYLHHAGQR